MSAPALAVQSVSPRAAWLWSRKWDLTFISLSVVLVAMPYLAYLGLLALQPVLQPVADRFGTNLEGASRNLVNFSVALLIGGPHMYATLTRTALDHGFMQRHRRLLLSSLAIPVVVVSLAFLNLTLLLTVFFFWASIHVLHQIIYITELYNHKRRTSLTLFARGADYAVILTALYPLAAWKISTGRFLIGTNDIGATVGQFVPVGPWMVWLAGGAFAVSLAAWLVSSIIAWRQGTLHVPKTLFIALTVTASFFVPALGNLDTAFQGMNVWHSVQYLALTLILNRLRVERGELKDSPYATRLAKARSGWRYYGFTLALTAADVALAAVLYVAFRFGLGESFDLAFDRAYYIAVLSFLWIHYYLDHFLFMRPAVVRA